MDLSNVPTTRRDLPRVSGMAALVSPLDSRGLSEGPGLSPRRWAGPVDFSVSVPEQPLGQFPCAHAGRCSQGLGALDLGPHLHAASLVHIPL